MSRPRERTPGIRSNRTQDRARTQSKLRDLSPDTQERIDRLTYYLDLNPDWIGALGINPLRSMLDQGGIATKIKLLELVPVGDERERAMTFHALRDAAFNSTRISRSIRLQQDDGHWPVKAKGQPPGIAKQMLLIGLMENLHFLGQFGGHRSWSVVKRGLRALLAYQKEDGRFPLPYHHHGAIGNLLIDLGIKSTPPIHKAAKWIASRQRTDGGWLHPSMAEDREKDRSCIWTTAEVFLFLSKYPTMNVKDTLRSAGDFVLKYALEENTTSLLTGKNSWNQLGVGSHGDQIFYGGTLKILEGLAGAGFNPSNSGFKKLYEWLLEQQLGNGLFPRIPGMDTRGEPLVTMRALKVIKKIETTRPEAKKSAPSEDDADISTDAVLE